MLTYENTSRPAASWWGRLDEWKGTIVLLPLCLWYATHRGEYGLLDNADLIIHEAGHVFARPFGQFASIAGGTVMQIALPALLAWNFRRQDYLLGTQVSSFWLGHNLLNISVYAADARARELPLLGGDGARHDWWTMLGGLNMLELDQVVGWTFFVIALYVFYRTLILPKSMRNDIDWLDTI